MQCQGCWDSKVGDNGRGNSFVLKVLFGVVGFLYVKEKIERCRKY
jgi:hypothetical protein